jgi:hypothetical protein
MVDTFYKKGFLASCLLKTPVEIAFLSVSDVGYKRRGTFGVALLENEIADPFLPDGNRSFTVHWGMWADPS